MNRFFKMALPALALVLAGAAQADDFNDYGQPVTGLIFSVESGQNDDYYFDRDDYQERQQRIEEARIREDQYAYERAQHTASRYHNRYDDNGYQQRPWYAGKDYRHHYHHYWQDDHD